MHNIIAGLLCFNLAAVLGVHLKLGDAVYSTPSTVANLDWWLSAFLMLAATLAGGFLLLSA